SEETIGQLCQHEMPQEEMLVSRWYAAGENLKPMVEELQSLSELIFLLPQQLLSQVIIENIRSHYPAIQQASERLLKAIFSRQGLKIALKDYWQNFYHNVASEEAIKWRVNGDLEWIHQQITGKVPVEIAWSSEQLHEEIYLAESLS